MKKFANVVVMIGAVVGIMIGTMIGTMAGSYAAMADASPSLSNALEDGQPYLKLRYRSEHVDQTGFAKDGLASTLRTLLGFKSGDYEGFKLVLEAENVLVVGNETYNSTVNGVTNRPVIADPDGTEVNKFYLSYDGFKENLIRVGRQDHNLDNQRFIGTVGWRQNDQAYDSAMLVNTYLPNTTLIYSYVDNVNRIFGEDHPFGDLDTATHVVNLSYSGLSMGKLTAYGYFIDLKQTAVAGLSSQTLGLRLSGNKAFNDQFKLLYAAEYADQSDYADNPVSFSTRYYSLEAGVTASNLTAKLGFESLGSDNHATSAFRTPLATLHKFNGWADKFLATPGAGLEDAYLSLSYQLPDSNTVFKKVKLAAVYHDFSAASGNADYGSEVDLLATAKLGKNYGVTLKFADYRADGFAGDTRKLWLVLTANFN